MTDLDFYWKRIIELKEGDRVGNYRGLVTNYGEYMLLEVEHGAKRTNCLDSARYLAGIYGFERVREIAL